MKCFLLNGLNQIKIDRNFLNHGLYFRQRGLFWKQIFDEGGMKQIEIFPIRNFKLVQIDFGGVERIETVFRDA